jgi:HEAT repeat protein
MRIAIFTCIYLLLTAASTGQERHNKRADVRVRQIVESRTPKPLKIDGMTVIIPKPAISSEEYEEVGQYGAEAVRVLSQYVRSENALQQSTALRLVGVIKNEVATRLLMKFAIESRFSSVRMSAIAYLAERPSKVMREFLMRRAAEDQDASVRAEAEKKSGEMAKQHPGT